MTYPAGHLKHEPETNQVAIRTIHDHPQMRWNVATSAAGARNATDEDVEGWDDLTPEP
ncbi:MAG: hypothetical protein QG655_2576 [Actinomycetota bacterium]|nr:hypothetical protein [Actinomycetota bacterium]HOW93258.1 hypothetical protein [Mycolicibacterium fallax]HSA41241.1 hypothetical protein [Mycobacterium sp.]